MPYDQNRPLVFSYSLLLATSFRTKTAILCVILKIWYVHNDFNGQSDYLLISAIISAIQHGIYFQVQNSQIIYLFYVSSRFSLEAFNYFKLSNAIKFEAGSISLNGFLSSKSLSVKNNSIRVKLLFVSGVCSSI